MAEKTIKEVLCGENGDSNDENEADSLTDDESVIKCVRLRLPEHILAYIEKRELLRDVEPLKCDKGLVEKVISNYVIIKQILSHMSWQEKMLCKHVSSTWHSAVRTLQKEQLSPEDFVMDLWITQCTTTGGIMCKKSGPFFTEPLAVLTFANSAGFGMSCKCKMIAPSPCTPCTPCDMKHCLMDLVQRCVSSPKECMLTVKATYLSYMPLPRSITYEHVITQHMFVTSNLFIGGIYIPAIPDVEFHVINLKTDCDMQKDFFDVVQDLTQTRIVKGVLVYVTEKYLLYSVGDIVFLNYFKDVQPDIPYALGGCIIDDVMHNQNDMDYLIDGINEGTCAFISENLISMALFTVPKTTDNIEQCDKYNFDMYSLIIDSAEWTKSKIQRTITEFSNKVPRFEHSVAIKLSCVGRDQKHELEQDYFRAAFPYTRLVGCYGNGELGINHPPRPLPTDAPLKAKRHRGDPGPDFGIMYSYSTVFVYIGWGKATPPQEP